MTTTAKRTDLLEREARFAALVRSGTSHVDAMFGAGYRPTSPSSAASFLRKLLARPRIVAAIGDERLVRRMRDRGPVLRLLPATDVALLERVVELALASGSTPDVVPAPLSAFERVVVRQLREQLVEIASDANASAPRTAPSGVPQPTGPTPPGDATPPDATGADPAAVERAAT